MTKPQVNVIIPTLANKNRQGALKRAINSVLNQNDVFTQPIVVVNGDKHSSDLISELKSNPAIILKTKNSPSACQARFTGVKVATADYLAFLDDDDELFPHALNNRLKGFGTENRYQAVISTGFKIYSGIKTKINIDVDALNKDPLLSLFKPGTNWLASCGGLFRNNCHTLELFKPTIEYMEWTLVAFRLCQNYPICFIDNEDFLINDSHNSLSQTENYMRSEEDLINLLKKHATSKRAQKLVEGKLAHFYHCLASEYLFKKNNKSTAF